MRKRQLIIDVIIDEIASAYQESYRFDWEKFDKFPQKNIAYICKYLINELNILGFDYARAYVKHFDTFDVEFLIYEVVGQWKAEIVGPDTNPPEKRLQSVDRFMRDQQLDDDNLFYGGGWDQVVVIYEANMGKPNVCGFYC